MIRIQPPPWDEDNMLPYKVRGFLGGSDGKKSACFAGGPGHHPWMTKITLRRKWLPTPAFLLGQFEGHRILWAMVHGVVVAMRSGKQTHSEGQCREWSAVYYTRGPKAESPLSQGPRQVFVKTLYTLSVLAQAHLPKFLETSLTR